MHKLFGVGYFDYKVYANILISAEPPNRKRDNRINVIIPFYNSKMPLRVLFSPANHSFFSSVS